MSRFIEGLRQQKEEIDRIANAEKEIKEAETRAWQDKSEAKRRLEEEERARIQAEKDCAVDFYNESGFQNLLETMRSLSPLGVSLVNQSLGFTIDRGTEVSGSYNWETNKWDEYSAPIRTSGNSRLTLAYWKTHDIDFGFFIGLSPYRGLVIEALPQGDIITHGRKKHVLQLNSWRNDPSLKEEALEAAYVHPFMLRKSSYSTSSRRGQNISDY